MHNTLKTTWKNILGVIIFGVIVIAVIAVYITIGTAIINIVW